MERRPTAPEGAKCQMEKLARALSVIQQGMLRNNPGHVKDSVSEATEVLSEMLNTHKCLLESGVEIQKRLESHPASKRFGYLSETAFCVSGTYPEEAEKGGEEGCSFSSRGANPKEREGQHIALLRRGHQRPDPIRGWEMRAGGKKEKKKKNKKKKEREVPAPPAQEPKEKKEVPRLSPAARSGDAIRVSTKGR